MIEQLYRYTVGNGTITTEDDAVRLCNGPTSRHAYTNAQFDDYQPLSRGDFLQRPPRTLSLRARFSHNAGDLRGTAGFGFWNDPFGMSGHRWPTLPRALWFFFSGTTSNMALAQNVPGPGWKAATIDAWRWPFLLLAPTAPLAMPLMKIPTLYKYLWPIGQRAIGVAENMVVLDMTRWHHYQIEWQPHSVCFAVDGRTILKTKCSPRGPLGLVIWKDNQAMTVTPWSLPRHQVVACNQEQWLELADVHVMNSVPGRRYL